MSLLLPLLLSLPVQAQARLISPDYSGNCQGPSWARDGSKLSYEVNYHDKKSIKLYVYEPGRSPREVLPGARGDDSLTAGFTERKSTRVVHEATWGPASMDRFVYSASNSKMDFDLYLERGGPMAPALGADGDPDWSGTGRWLVFTSARSGQGDLYLLDLYQAGSAPIKLTHNAHSAELDAAFSPSEDQLVYVAHTDQGDNIYLIDDLTAPQPKQITSWSRSQVRPSWSPDGTHLAFYANHDFAGRTDLYVMRLGSRPYTVAQGVIKSHDGPSWTPDGQHLVYVQDDDDAFDPVFKVPIANPDRAQVVPTQTVGNGDLDVVKGTDGKTWIAVAAQGRLEDTVRDFKRIYIMPLP